MRFGLLILVIVLCASCKPSLEQCVPPAPAVPPAACRSGGGQACGTLATADGDVDCGSCPEGLTCGEIEANVCGGLVCTAFNRVDQQFIRELVLAWSPDAGAYESASIFGTHFTTPLEDGVPQISGVDAVGTPLSTAVSIKGNVVTANVSFGSFGQSGSGSRIMTCKGSVISSTVGP